MVCHQSLVTFQYLETQRLIKETVVAETLIGILEKNPWLNVLIMIICMFFEGLLTRIYLYFLTISTVKLFERTFIYIVSENRVMYMDFSFYFIIVFFILKHTDENF